MYIHCVCVFVGVHTLCVFEGGHTLYLQVLMMFV